jgi:hypothetical protein
MERYHPDFAKSYAASEEHPGIDPGGWVSEKQ